jgi:glyoxylase-like metal-dependent hydrolase (beta-lactamase superfamily II)
MDVKILINTHAHFDHAGGMAQLKADTGAKVWASRPTSRLWRRASTSATTKTA